MRKEYDWHNIDSMKCKDKSDMLDKMNILCKLDYHAEVHLNKEYSDELNHYATIYIVDTNRYD